MEEAEEGNGERERERKGKEKRLLFLLEILSLVGVYTFDTFGQFEAFIHPLTPSNLPTSSTALFVAGKRTIHQNSSISTIYRVRKGSGRIEKDRKGFERNINRVPYLKSICDNPTADDNQSMETAPSFQS